MAENDSNNPYQVPATDVLAARREAPFSDTPRAVPAGNGVQWIADAWALFKQSPGGMILLVVIYMVLNMVTGFIPLLNFVSPIINMVFLGGAFIAIRRLDTEGELKIEDLFSAFKTHLTPLLLLGLLMIGVMVVIVVVVMALGMGTMMSSNGDPSAASLVLFVFVVLLGLALFFLLYFTVFYSVLLIVLGNQELGPALSNAFASFMKNWLPFLVNGILALLITAVALIPFGLGLLVSGPVLFASMYTSYKDIFAAE